MKLFARARDLAGADTVRIALPSESTVRQLRAQLAVDFPRLAALVPHLLVAINGDYAADETVLTPIDEVACFPPVSGG